VEDATEIVFLAYFCIKLEKIIFINIINIMMLK